MDDQKTTTCRDCGTFVNLDVTQEYQLCSVCQEIELMDDACSRGEDQ